MVLGHKLRISSIVFDQWNLAHEVHLWLRHPVFEQTYRLLQIVDISFRIFHPFQKGARDIYLADQTGTS